MKAQTYEVGDYGVTVDEQGGLTIEDEENLCYFSWEEVIVLLDILMQREQLRGNQVTAASPVIEEE